jgi:hypothetical protein
LHFKPGAAIQNKQTKKDDLKIMKTNKVFEGRFEEKKLDFIIERNGLDFDNLVEQVYPKEYIPGRHDNDIREILKTHRLDNYSFEPKNQISHDNYKLLLVLMKNKKAALFENNFYNLEYSTDWDKIVGDNNYRSRDSKEKNHDPDNYGEMFKTLLKKK